jgi:hypothetical protein
MLVYFALSHSQKYVRLVQEEGVENVLISYAFYKSIDQVKDLFKDYEPKNLIIDSGAFSVWTRNEFIDIDKYAEFCFEIKKHFVNSTVSYVNLDVLPGKFGKRPTQEQRQHSAEQGWKNMLYLEAKGLKVIPVFHQHEDFEWLDKLRNHCDYIGISPANDVSMNEKLNWLNKVFSVIKDTIKTHGFAVTSYSQLSKYPFYSVDSSSWTAPARFGSIPTIQNGKIKVFKYKDKDSIIANWDTISHVGIDELSSKDDWKPRIRVAVQSYLKLEKIINEIWDARGIKYES